MPSPWVDLLCLHGHIADVKLLRELAALPSSKPPPDPAPTKTRVALAKKAVTSLRLCLGIGDGLLRSQ